MHWDRLPRSAPDVGFLATAPLLRGFRLRAMTDQLGCLRAVRDCDVAARGPRERQDQKRAESLELAVTSAPVF